MEYSIKDIADVFGDLFYRRPSVKRNLIMYTNAFGFDTFSEAVEENIGLKRVYLGRKIPRVLRLLRGKILLSASGRYYRSIRM